MKITTDACIQGAWTPVSAGITRVLDIGAGTGILSLMLAQRNPDIVIDAVEFDHDAAMQAVENVKASGWKERINVLQGDIRNYIAPARYDLIISNPPFFNNSLLSDKANKNLARHTLSLSYSDLLQAIDNNLNQGGYASIMLPYTEYLEWKEGLDENKWYESHKLFIRHKEGAVIKRVVTVFGKKRNPEIKEDTLIIKGNENLYTPEFTDLLSPFYLNL